MRNYFVAAMLGLLFMGCAVDNDDLYQYENQVETINLEINYNCYPSYNIENFNSLLGKLVISNSSDGQTAFFEFTTEPGFYITEIKSLMAEELAEFPQNNGGIIPGKLEKTTYNRLSEVQLESEFSDSFVFAALITLVDDEGINYSVWVGDQEVGKKSSKYLFYTACPPSECTISAGSDVYITWTEAYRAANVRSPLALERELLAALDSGVPLTGTFDPTPPQLIEQYLSGGRLGNTEYTVSDGYCSDSTIIYLEVIED